MENFSDIAQSAIEKMAYSLSKEGYPIGNGTNGTILEKREVYAPNETVIWHLSSPLLEADISVVYKQTISKPMQHIGVLRISAIADIIAKYYGYHRCALALPTLEEMFVFSDKVKKQFSPCHRHWGVENRVDVLQFLFQTGQTTSSLSFKDEDSSDDESDEEERDKFGGSRMFRKRQVNPRSFVSVCLAGAWLYENDDLANFLKRFTKMNALGISTRPILRAQIQASIWRRSSSEFFKFMTPDSNSSQSSRRLLNRIFFSIFQKSNKAEKAWIIETLKSIKLKEHFWSLWHFSDTAFDTWKKIFADPLTKELLLCVLTNPKERWLVENATSEDICSDQPKKLEIDIDEDDNEDNLESCCDGSDSSSESSSED